jgi:hypothetical protein
LKRRVPGLGTLQLLSLDGKWIKTNVQRFGWLTIREGFESGMSGSPILDDAGNAIGVVSTDEQSPVLIEHLPVGLVQRDPGLSTKQARGEGSSTMIFLLYPPSSAACVRPRAPFTSLAHRA